MNLSIRLINTISWMVIGWNIILVLSALIIDKNVPWSMIYVTGIFNFTVYPIFLILSMIYLFYSRGKINEEYIRFTRNILFVTIFVLIICLVSLHYIYEY